MIPDDATIIIVEKDTVVEEKEILTGTVCIGTTGLPGILDPEAVAHFRNFDDPHDSKFADLVVPQGKNGRWLKIINDAISDTHEVPLFQEDIRPPYVHDEKVRVDEFSPQDCLARHMMFPFHVAFGTKDSPHKVRIKGDEGIARRTFYGTDKAGTVGFHRVPGEQVIP